MMALAPAAEAATGRAMARIARGMAMLGGLLLVAIALMVCLSIIGRQLDGLWMFRPVRGDYELVEAGTAIAVFAFLPWCQLNRGHVSVDLVAQKLSPRRRAVSGLVGDVLLAIVATVIAWRLFLGFGEKFPHGGDGVRQVLGWGSPPVFAETTYELAIPVWIPYGLAWIGAALFCLTAMYCVWRSLNWVLQGWEPAP